MQPQLRMRANGGVIELAWLVASRRRL